tara:strand:- start:145 stop:519 length:375 start_codon:yes stop_codon:yes gene_type:complete
MFILLTVGYMTNRLEPTVNSPDFCNIITQNLHSGGNNSELPKLKITGVNFLIGTIISVLITIFGFLYPLLIPLLTKINEVIQPNYKSNNSKSTNSSSFSFSATKPTPVKFNNNPLLTRKFNWVN